MNSGFINENELCDYINKYEYYNNYNTNIKKFLEFTFGTNFNVNSKFSAIKKGGQIKPDLCITHNGKDKYISIKKGSGNSIHQESIEMFFPYIETMIGTNCLNILKKFHYGDDTLDDTGITRYNATQCKRRYASDIVILNNSLNSNQNIIKLLDRFIFIGNKGTLSTDIVYHGTIDSGLWASRDEIIHYITGNKFNSAAVHFGPLTYQVWGRNENRVAVNPKRRYVMQVKWGTIAKNLEAIRKED